MVPESQGFSKRDLEALRRLQLTGDAWAVPEGTAVFVAEPLIEVTAPIPEEQLAETVLLNPIDTMVRAACGAIPSADIAWVRYWESPSGPSPRASQPSRRANPRGKPPAASAVWLLRSSRRHRQHARHRGRSSGPNVPIVRILGPASGGMDNAGDLRPWRERKDALILGSIK